MSGKKKSDNINIPPKTDTKFDPTLILNSPQNFNTLLTPNSYTKNKFNFTNSFGIENDKTKVQLSGKKSDLFSDNSNHGKKLNSILSMKSDSSNTIIQNNKQTEIYYKDKKNRNISIPLGDVRMWKACNILLPSGELANCYVELVVPSSAKRVTPLTHNNLGDNKTMGLYGSRVSQAHVVSIQNLEGVNYGSIFVYNKDATLTSQVFSVGRDYIDLNFDVNPMIDCNFENCFHMYKDNCFLA